MANLVRRAIEESGHAARVAHDGVAGLQLAYSLSPDVIVLDIMLPGLHGFDFARRLRAEENRTPILMLTGRDAMEDIVKGLNVGADDYLTKPFSLQVLIARLQALARRAAALPSTRLQIADLILDLETREVWRTGTKIALTKTEFDILEFLMRRSGRVVTRNALIEGVWGMDRDIESNTLDAFMRLLRSKVDADASKRLIQTIRAVGYVLREEW